MQLQILIADDAHYFLWALLEDFLVIHGMEKIPSNDFFLLKCFGLIKNKQNTSKKKFICRWIAYVHEYCKNINSVCSSRIHMKRAFLCVFFLFLMNASVKYFYRLWHSCFVRGLTEASEANFLLHQIFCYENAPFFFFFFNSFYD